MSPISTGVLLPWTLIKWLFLFNLSGKQIKSEFLLLSLLAWKWYNCVFPWVTFRSSTLQLSQSLSATYTVNSYLNFVCWNKIKIRDPIREVITGWPYRIDNAIHWINKHLDKSCINKNILWVCENWTRTTRLTECLPKMIDGVLNLVGKQWEI